VESKPFKGFKADIMSTILYVFFIVIGFSLSWLAGAIKSSQIILYTLGTIIVISIFQSLLAWFTINTAKEKTLADQINKIHQTTESLMLSLELRKEGMIKTTPTFMEEESKMKEVWVVIEDLGFLADDKDGFFKFNIENVKRGMKYVYFTSKANISSTIIYFSRITNKPLRRNESIPKQIKVEKGIIEFVFVDPNAFLFVSPITIWNPTCPGNEVEEQTKVLLDFPQLPAGYHLVVEYHTAKKIINRLNELYRAKDA